MYYARIKDFLKNVRKRREAALLAFQIAHFLIDLVIVLHIVWPGWK